MSYSSDMRGRALKLISSGKKISDVSEAFGIHRQTLHRWLRETKRGQTRAGRPGPRGNRLVCEKALRQAIKARDDARLIELADHFGVHPSTISKALKRMGVSRKKNVAVHRGKTL